MLIFLNFMRSASNHCAGCSSRPILFALNTDFWRLGARRRRVSPDTYETLKTSEIVIQTDTQGVEPLACQFVW
jgi:hypothetical protein